VVNPNPERGPFSSLQVGLAGLAGPLFAGPLDCPVAPILAALLQGLTPEDEAVVPTFSGRGGHPVLLGADLRTRLLELDAAAPDTRLDEQLRQARTRRLEVADFRVALNLNRPEEWERFRLGSLTLPPHHPGPQ
jgi:CTP:molybdopterin cytidylyltransferase MocA